MATAQITRTFETYEGDTEPGHLWSVSANGERIAELWVSPANGEILNVWTHENHREQGHATALYHQAHADLAGRIFHAPEGHRTDDGDRFAARVGGETLTCTTCCAHLDDTDDDYTEED